MTDTKKQIDWTKPVVTSDGRPVRVLATDLKSEGVAHRIAYAVTHISGTDYIGTCDGDDDVLGFRNAPEKHSMWINVYRNDNGVFLGSVTFLSQEAAMRNSASSQYYVTAGKVEWEE